MSCILVIFKCHNLNITNANYIPLFRSLTLLFPIVFKATAKELSIKVPFSYNLALIEAAEKESFCLFGHQQEIDVKFLEGEIVKLQRTICNIADLADCTI